MANDLAVGLGLGLKAASMAGAWDEAEKDRALREAMAKRQHEFTAEQAGLERAYGTSEREAGEAFRGGEAEKLRTHGTSEREATSAAAMDRVMKQQGAATLRAGIAEGGATVRSIAQRGVDLIKMGAEAPKNRALTKYYEERAKAEEAERNKPSGIDEISNLIRRGRASEEAFREEHAEKTRLINLYATTAGWSQKSREKMAELQQELKASHEDLMIEQQALQAFSRKLIGTVKAPEKPSVEVRSLVDDEGKPMPGHEYKFSINDPMGIGKPLYDHLRGMYPDSKKTNTEPELRESLGDQLMNMYNNRNMPTAPGLGLAPATGGVVLPGTGR